MASLSVDTARRIALGAQGFADPRPSGRVDVRHFRRVLSRIGLLQIDSVNVLVRSHYLPVLARLGPYDTAALDRYTTASGELFEYWGHAASFLPSQRHPLFRWRMATMKPWTSVQELQAEHPGYVESVFREVERRGPLTVSGLDDGGERTGPWWGHGRGKYALEWLFARGRITATRGPNFERRYDLPERVVPREHLDRSDVPEQEAHRKLLGLSVRHHGIGTANDLADYYRLNRTTARKLLAGMAAAGEVEEVSVDGWKDPAYLDPRARIPRAITGSALLSPFDPVVWERDRAERLFGFQYRIEIYVPAPKRVYGYYVLPYLVDGEIVGRVDFKAHRSESVLEMRAAHLEDGRDAKRVGRRLAADAVAMAGWLGLDDVSVSASGPLATVVKHGL